MMTTGVYVLLVAGVLAVVFGVVASVVGMRAAFVTFCWVPLAGLLLTIGFHHHLGYSVIGLLTVTIAASAGLTCLGAGLRAKAQREAMASRPLMIGTFVAGLPLALTAVWLAVNSF